MSYMPNTWCPLSGRYGIDVHEVLNDPVPFLGRGAIAGDYLVHHRRAVKKCGAALLIIFMV